MFHVPKDRLFFAPGTKGGVGIKKREGGTSPHSSKSFVSGVCSYYSDSMMTIQKKSGETIAALWDMPLSGPGVAIVGIYPCGKARNRPPEGR